MYDNDYSKWANLDTSSEDEAPKQVTPTRKSGVETAVSATPSRLFEMGFDHYVGRNGRVKDPSAAAKLWAVASEHGNGRAQTSLAQLYYNGDGVPRNEHKAMELYAKAAESGDARAKHSLAV